MQIPRSPLTEAKRRNDPPLGQVVIALFMLALAMLLVAAISGLVWLTASILANLPH